MTSSNIFRTVPALVAVVLVLLSIAGCTDSPETRRKQAQSTGDKYWELLKAGNAQGAYDQTFSAAYKRELPAESYVKFNDLLSKSIGPITGYQVVKYDAAPAKQSVLLGYAVQAANSTEPLMFDVTLVQEGAEWKISSVEPKIQRQAPAAPPAPSLRAPAQPPAQPENKKP
jgi:hypothetical protein